MPESGQLHINDKRIIGWISEDGSAGTLLKKLAGLCPRAGKDDIYNKVVGECPYITEAALNYVPDDIVCYSDLTAGQFLHGIIMAQAKPDKAKAEAIRLIRLFGINPEEPLLDMTFEQNRLVVMVQSLIAGPDMLLLDQPHDMIGEESYGILISELARFYKKGGNIMIASHSYEEMVFPCEQYIYLRDGEIVANFMRNQLIKPAKMITLADGSLEWMDYGKMTILRKEDNKVQFIYKENNMQELALRICKTGCRDFTVEDISREELVYGNFERWSL